MWGGGTLPSAGGAGASAGARSGTRELRAAARARAKALAAVGIAGVAGGGAAKAGGTPTVLAASGVIACLAMASIVPITGPIDYANNELRRIVLEAGQSLGKL